MAGDMTTSPLVHPRHKAGLSQISPLMDDTGLSYHLSLRIKSGTLSGSSYSNSA